MFYLNPIQVNCPDCQKLFLVKEEDLYPGEVHFQCSTCDTPFAIAWPQPPGIEQLRAYHWGESPDLEKNENDQSKFKLIKKLSVNRFKEAPATRICFKCSEEVDLRSPECPKCGVVFIKQERTPSVIWGTMKGARIREVRMKWEQVKLDFGDLKKHDEFIKFCLDCGALAFASQQYKKILDASPGDTFAKSMHKRIIELATQNYLVEQRRIEFERNRPGRKFEAFMIGMGMLSVVSGLFVNAARPMLAVGCALLVFIFSLRYMKYGITD